jgi:tartrate-resistant acid phosphatase type 5
MSIICLGDFGSGTVEQYKVAKLIRNLIKKKRNCKLILGLGDNFYPDGVLDKADPQFITKFEEPYAKIPDSIKFYNILGNHDYKGNPQAEIDYTTSNIGSGKWVLPHNFYCFDYKIGGAIVEFFAVDTNFDKMSNENRKIQEKWIDEALTYSKAKWKIVYGHHPWKSSGQHGSTLPDSPLDIFYSNLVERHEVNLILSGHDHDQQHIAINGYPDLVVSGVGSKIRTHPEILRNLKPGLKFYSERLGCCLIEINKERLKVNFYDVNGTRVYYFYVQK